MMRDYEIKNDTILKTKLYNIIQKFIDAGIYLIPNYPDAETAKKHKEALGNQIISENDEINDFIEALNYEKIQCVETASQNKLFPHIAEMENKKQMTFSDYNELQRKEYYSVFHEIGMSALHKIKDAYNSFINNDIDSFIRNYQEVIELEEKFYRDIETAKSRISKGKKKSGKFSEKKKRRNELMILYFKRKYKQHLDSSAGKEFSEYTKAIADVCKRFNVS